MNEKKWILKEKSVTKRIYSWGRNQSIVFPLMFGL